MESTRQEGESLAGQAKLEERILPANGNVTELPLWNWSPNISVVVF